MLPPPKNPNGGPKIPIFYFSKYLTFHYMRSAGNICNFTKKVRWRETNYDLAYMQ